MFNTPIFRRSGAWRAGWGTGKRSCAEPRASRAPVPSLWAQSRLRWEGTGSPPIRCPRVRPLARSLSKCPIPMATLPADACAEDVAFFLSALETAVAAIVEMGLCGNDSLCQANATEGLNGQLWAIKRSVHIPSLLPVLVPLCITFPSWIPGANWRPACWTETFTFSEPTKSVPSPFLAITGQSLWSRNISVDQEQLISSQLNYETQHCLAASSVFDVVPSILGLGGSGILSSQVHPILLVNPPCCMMMWLRVRDARTCATG